MWIFGYHIGPGELLAFAWICSALAHCIPPPAKDSNVFYKTVYNLAQFACSNLKLLTGGVEPEEPPKVVPIDRPSPFKLPPSDLPPAA